MACLPQPGDKGGAQEEGGSLRRKGERIQLRCAATPTATNPRPATPHQSPYLPGGQLWGCCHTQRGQHVGEIFQVGGQLACPQRAQRGQALQLL